MKARIRKKPVLLETRRIKVLRHISPRKRWSEAENNLVPLEWLVENGLAIGNDLDTKANPHHLGSSIKKGMWPVYALGKNSSIEYYLNKSCWLNPPGSVAYIACVNLDLLEIGINAAFPNSQVKKFSTMLEVVPLEDKFALRSKERLKEIDEKLRVRFNEEGLLYDLSGEFFLSGYTNPKQLESERIFKSNGEAFEEITEEVLETRR